MLIIASVPAWGNGNPAVTLFPWALPISLHMVEGRYVIRTNTDTSPLFIGAFTATVRLALFLVAVATVFLKIVLAKS